MLLLLPRWGGFYSKQPSYEKRVLLFFCFSSCTMGNFIKPNRKVKKTQSLKHKSVEIASYFFPFDASNLTFPLPSVEQIIRRTQVTNINLVTSMTSSIPSKLESVREHYTIRWFSNRF